MDAALHWCMWLLSTVFFTAIAAGSTMEQRQSVWIMACFGSAGAALYGPKRNLILILLHWLVGVFFATAFVSGIDHFQPESEALFVGLASGVATKTYIDAFGAWVGGFAVRLAGGSQHVR